MAGFTQADLAALRLAMNTVAIGGVSDIEINGHSIKYKPLKELQEYYKYVESQVYNAENGTLRKVQFNSTTDTY